MLAGDIDVRQSSRGTRGEKKIVYLIIPQARKLPIRAWRSRVLRDYSSRVTLGAFDGGWFLAINIHPFVCVTLIVLSSIIIHIHIHVSLCPLSFRGLCLGQHPRARLYATWIIACFLQFRRELAECPKASRPWQASLILL